MSQFSWFLVLNRQVILTLPLTPINTYCYNRTQSHMWLQFAALNSNIILLCVMCLCRRVHTHTHTRTHTGECLSEVGLVFVKCYVMLLDICFPNPVMVGYCCITNQPQRHTFTISPSRWSGIHGWAQCLTGYSVWCPERLYWRIICFQVCSGYCQGSVPGWQFCNTCAFPWETS